MCTEAVKYWCPPGSLAESWDKKHQEMDPLYLSQFSDDFLRKRLFVDSQISSLAEILLEDGRRLIDLEEKGVRGDERRCRLLSLNEAFPSICSDVDGFLGVQGINQPSIEMFSLFDGSNRDILRTYSKALGAATLAGSLGVVSQVTKRWARPSGKAPSSMSRRTFLGGLVLGGASALWAIQGIGSHWVRYHDAGYLPWREAISISPVATRIEAELTLAHEYVHHIQKSLGFWWTAELNLRQATEGIARGAERHFAMRRSQLFAEAGLERQTLRMRVPELRAVYLLACRELGQLPDPSLLKTLDPLPGGREIWSGSLGYAVFRVAEREAGARLYRSILAGEFRWD